MGLGVAPAKINSLVVEDDKTDRLHIAQKLRSTPIFQPVFYDNYKKYPFMERAMSADIVSLDLEIDNRRADSLFICKQLNKHNPDKSVIFFTSNPDDVLDEPINFVLRKSDDVWAAYDRLLMMIVVHDRTLSVLRHVVGLSTDYEELKKQYAEIRERLAPFMSSLISIQNVFEKENKTVARHYRKLGRILKRMNSVGDDEPNVYFRLHEMQEPLRSLVKEELAEIKKVDGVFVTEKLESEIEGLDASIASQEAVRDSRSFTERALVYAAGTISDSLKAVSEMLSTDKAAAEIDEAVSTQEADEESLYINAWFPDYEDKNALTVNVAAELRINLDYMSRTAQSQLIPVATAEILNAAGAVDVMVMSPVADIDPIIQTLELPPNADRYVSFSVVAKQPGQIDLTVLLLLRNEPIFRTVFSCDAVTAIGAVAAFG